MLNGPAGVGRVLFPIVGIFILGAALFFYRDHKSNQPQTSFEVTPEASETYIRNKAGLSPLEGKTIAEGDQETSLPEETRFLVPGNAEELHIQIYELADGSRKYVGSFMVPADLYHAYLSSSPKPNLDPGWEHVQALRTDYSALRELSHDRFQAKIVYVADGAEKTKAELEIKTK